MHGNSLGEEKEHEDQNLPRKRYSLPHIHIDYGRQQHAASYAIGSSERIEGSLSKKYDSDVSSWLERNREKVLEIWNALQSGAPYEPLVAELSGDA
ncbi:DUF4160 domain-containing protein [Vreelandella stevensii]|uniref:DUF4160 domain-containing protein n=1 Tax=Vreelandella stevensii TaxID=502821 RepID=UPI00403A8B5D